MLGPVSAEVEASKSSFGLAGSSQKDLAGTSQGDLAESDLAGSSNIDLAGSSHSDLSIGAAAGSPAYISDTSPSLNITRQSIPACLKIALEKGELLKPSLRCVLMDFLYEHITKYTL